MTKSLSDLEWGDLVWVTPPDGDDPFYDHFVAWDNERRLILEKTGDVDIDFVDPVEGKMSWSAIRQFTRTASYAVDVPWDDLEHLLVKWAKYGNSDLDPDFQRAHVWDETKQRRYVEYVLRGGKSSRDLYFNQPSWPSIKVTERLELVDGKQRLEAARKFLRNELTVFNGLLFADFEGKPSYEVSFKFHVNDLVTRAEVLQWYLDLNEGGVVHTSEELKKVRQLLQNELSKH